MRHNLPKIMEHVFLWEGGYVDHKDDPGGATNMGITIHTMKALALDLDKDGDVDKTDVMLITKALATDIYKVRYWNAVDGDDMPNGIDGFLMDSGVNSGPRAGVRWLQRAAGITPDGILGPQTRRAADTDDPKGLVSACIEERLKSVRQFRNYNTFGVGWERRINSLEKMCLKLTK